MPRGDAPGGGAGRGESASGSAPRRASPVGSTSLSPLILFYFLIIKIKRGMRGGQDAPLSTGQGKANKARGRFFSPSVIKKKTVLGGCNPAASGGGPRCFFLVGEDTMGQDIYLRCGGVSAGGISLGRRAGMRPWTWRESQLGLNLHYLSKGLKYEPGFYPGKKWGNLCA